MLPATWAPRRPGSALRAPAARLVPLKRSLLPDIGESDEQHSHEHEHFAQAEEGNLCGRTRSGHEWDGTGELPVVRTPRNHEHALDVENDEQHRNHVELDGQALPGVAENWNARLVRGLFFWGRAGPYG